MVTRRLAFLVAALLLFSGCTTLRDIVGITMSDPSINQKSAESRWLLIRNPRFGDVPSEPEYVWVEEDKVPFTLRGLFNKSAIIAPPEVVAKYGSPPGGGKISPQQGVPYQPAAEPGRVTGSSRAVALPVPRPGAAPAVAPVPVEVAKRGYVVYVDTTRIVIDLTGVDGVRPGTVVSLRRDRIPIVHPVTGEMLGDLDEEVATARVTETREKFSVAEIQTLAPGSQVQLKDRVVLK
jgi:hypothetical protein